MNPINYCTLEAAKRLHDAGIVLETDTVWIFKVWIFKSGWNLERKVLTNTALGIPAPTPAEVWNELCKVCMPDIHYSIDGLILASTEDSPSFYSTNLADALIDLLIWVRKEKVNDFKY